jgi:hypothetical protein
MAEDYDRAATFRVLAEITAERDRQVDQHGHNPKKDDRQPMAWWGWLLARRATDLSCPVAEFVGDSPRRQLLEIAAIAVAALESLDRRELGETLSADEPPSSLAPPQHFQSRLGDPEPMRPPPVVRVPEPAEARAGMILCRPGEPVTPSFTEAEWAEVLAAWLAAKHTSMFGRARPTANAEDRAEAAAEMAAWLIDAAGELLEG